MSCLKRGKHLIEVAPGLIEGQAAESIVAAEFDDDCIGVKSNDGRNAGDCVLGRSSAGASIDDSVVVTLRVELALQCIWEGLSLGQSITGRDAVAKAYQDVRRRSSKKAG